MKKHSALLVLMVLCLSLLLAACEEVSTSTPGPAQNEWSWISGADMINQSGFYGVMSVPTATTGPGARDGAVAWTDKNGNFWFFGGDGWDSTGTQGELNDLWKFDGRLWTWVNGASVADQPGVYNVESLPTSTAVPGSRGYAVSWTDTGGNFWLFGGSGYDSQSQQGFLNDLWKFDGSNWTWVSGDNIVNQSGVYGVMSVPSGTNCPGSRLSSVTWVDEQGNLWLFGGYGFDANGDTGNLNDLWKFDGSNWTWMNGANVVNQSGNYGTQGVSQGTNEPGARYAAVSWTDADGVFWLFGGSMYSTATGTNIYFNDLWKYDGSNWTWISGNDIPNQAGVYGVQGIAASTNVPRARSSAVSWIDNQGNLWLFGGESYDLVNTTCQLNDMWKFDGMNWIWMNGSNATNQPGFYGPPNTIAAEFMPGAREGSIAWSDTGGNLWLFGGLGYGLISNTSNTLGDLNDTWVYLP